MPIDIPISGGRRARVVETIVAGNVALEVEGAHWSAGLDLPRPLVDAGDHLLGDRFTSGIQRAVTCSYGSAVGGGDEWPFSDAQAMAFKRYSRALAAIKDRRQRQAIEAVVFEGLPADPRLLAAGLKALAVYYTGLRHL